MACDHALAESVGRGASAPVLRLYGWSPPAVSIGYAQPAAARAAELEALRERGYSIVRRPTGGAAVVHDVEVTYAVALPSVLAGPRARETCARVHAALRRGLERLGLSGLSTAGARAWDLRAGPAHGTPCREAGPIPGGGGPAVSARSAAAAGACFAHASASEITWHGRKLVGSAQRRLAGSFLQHGAVPLEDRQQVLESVWPGSGPAAAVVEAAARPVSPAELGEALVAGFEEVFGAELRLDGLAAQEAERARRLAIERYGTEAFLYRI